MPPWPVVTGGVCTICHQRPRGSFTVSLHGELTCCRHEIDGDCTICRRPRPSRATPGWGLLAPQHPSCPTCADGAIGAQSDVRRVLPGIKAELADLGFALRRPVRVTLATLGELAALTNRPSGPNDPTTFGITIMQGREARGGPAEVLNVQILSRLPPAVFGRTVTHEAAHAWAAQVGARAVEPMVEEGLCELIAYAWLKRQPGALAEGLRAAIASNPDPTYGDGFRAVQRAVRIQGIRVVLTSLQQTGYLPGPSRPHGDGPAVRFRPG